MIRPSLNNCMKSYMDLEFIEILSNTEESHSLFEKRRITKQLRIYIQISSWRVSFRSYRFFRATFSKKYSIYSWECVYRISGLYFFSFDQGETKKTNSWQIYKETPSTTSCAPRVDFYHRIIIPLKISCYILLHIIRCLFHYFSDKM